MTSVTYNVKLVFTLLVLYILIQFFESWRECTPIIRRRRLPDVQVA